jgi:hypothetical protein
MIEQTKKLRLDALHVESFVTTNNSGDVKGGTSWPMETTLWPVWYCGPTDRGANTNPNPSGGLITCATCGYNQGCIATQQQGCSQNCGGGSAGCGFSEAGSCSCPEQIVCV